MSQTRRDFLKSALGASTLLSLAPTAPVFLARTALAGAERKSEGDTALVLIELSGGNDGLNTVVPYADDAYARSRPTIRLPEKSLHKIGTDLGLHPRMEAFQRLYQEGHLSIVQGVGYPNPEGDHFAAMRNWHTARPHDTTCQTGWAGRAIDRATQPEQGKAVGLFVGPGSRPLALNSEKVPVLALRSLDQWKLRALPGDKGDAYRNQLGQLAGLRRQRENPLLDFVERTTAGAYADSRKLDAIAQDAGGAEYPPYQLAERLRTISQLLRADCGVRIFFTELGGDGFGGFDNHANQIGNHCALLEQLARSVAAFVADLKRQNLLDRVLVATFSEFGRTVSENGRRGTDHGAAAPMFLAGGRLKGGLVGEHPSLTDLANNGLKFRTDFRRVYATLLDRWLGFDSKAVLGGGFEPLELLKG
ncbi:MAG: DUF1501 domain-containing protein [Pirellulales bacterium]|nr:DUF1501 domain-containing protein [Pirellulales bacterium]